MFQHTAARRRLAHYVGLIIRSDTVSTHSRPKAAGKTSDGLYVAPNVSTHSRPKAAGAKMTKVCIRCGVSTHSRPKAAGRMDDV